MTKIVGYTRRLVGDVDVADDIEALRRAGATMVFTEVTDSQTSEVAGFGECLRTLGVGDTLVATSGARIAHTVNQFLGFRSDLVSRGVAFLSLSEPALSSGQMVDPDELFAALDGFRRRLIGLRTRHGMVVAAAEGRRAGRPSVITEERLAIARELRNQKRSFAQIGRALGVSTSAIQRALAEPRSSATPLNQLGGADQIPPR
ncbi:MAG: recombinase family protein [Microbacterium sp.]|uniref:recombinase family protein n=1 Tax=Microbacterium sp. TaxID=51671 RepID=UPI001AD570DE|nr:recombinase family protein [Microbacterium sp.]MBN9154701.1 recombinase family protein [Microbacterium sp.]